VALALGATVAAAQPSCDPATTPCQTCPEPPPCAPSAVLCQDVGSGSSNTTFTTSTLTCGGAFPQSTVTLEATIGPANICVGPDRSVGCQVATGSTNFNAHTDTILGGAVAVPTLSLWALGGLAVAVGALALRRLAAPPS
jgi:hypothetical protein